MPTPRTRLVVSTIGFGVTVLAFGTQVLAYAQSGDKPDKKRDPRRVTLSGCVERGPTPNEYTIDDDDSGKFRVSGGRISQYVGQRVEVTGNVNNSRLRMRLGLYPSPNAAGQAGAADPVKSAIAAQPGGSAAGTGAVSLPELQVRTVKSVEGGCG